MNIHIAADHAGFDLKEQLKTYITELGYTVTDHGAFTLDTNDDYPDFVTPCAEAVAADEQSGDLSRVSRGIVIGGSGQGEAMDANRISGIRATEYYGGDVEIVRISREHNNANVLSLGARFMSEEEAKEAVKVFLETPFSGEKRHERRIDKMD
jgi:ribose 5-phosphate isomerase B